MRRRFEAIVLALCGSFIDTHERASAGTADRQQVVAFVLSQTMRKPDYLRAPFIALTHLFDLASVVLDGRRFCRLDWDRRRARIEKARNSRLRPLRDLIRYYEGLTVFGLADENLGCERRGDESAGNELTRVAVPPNGPTGPAFAQALPAIAAGLGGPAPEALPDEIWTEIVVVGSGPGGSVTACLLAEAGRDVIMIESGPLLPLDACAPFTGAEMERKYRNGGLTVAFGRTNVAYVEARCVGGGSEINAGLYHRTPHEILNHWRHTHLLEAAQPEDMRAHFEYCERDLSVSFLPGEAPTASMKLHAGALRQGWTSLEVPRWVKYETAATGSIGTRQTMSRTYLPRAIKAGCRLIPDMTARNLRRRGAGWTIEADRRQPGASATRHRLHCETVFVCAGAIQTPALLRASGIARQAGRTLRMHPTIKAVACFPEAVNSEQMGVPVHQVKEFAPRLSFGCSISSQPYLRLGLLEHTPHIANVARDWRRMASYYAMSSGGSGSIRVLPFCDDPLVRYRLSDVDMGDLADGLHKLCELLFAAGAEAVYPSVRGLGPLYSSDDLKRIPESLPHGRTSLMTVHMFSSCPMGEDRTHCVADSFGRVHGYKNLYVADASLLCTAPGVNPQGSVIAFARRNALHFLAHGRS